MAKLKSMKLDREDREKMYPTAAEGADLGPSYPWGLRLELDNETIEKLGIALPEVGKNLMVIARVKVESVSSSENTENGRPKLRRSASLQITEMCIEADEGEGGDVAAKLYDHKD